MKYAIFDIETDGLYDDVTKIHCLAYRLYDDGKLLYEDHITNYNEMKEFFNNNEVLVGHNIIRYDIPVAEKILGIKIESRLIDTLPLSWYLYPMKTRHGLEQWGDDLGVKKPEIKDWKHLTVEEYIHRCETDVKINELLYELLSEYLLEIYENNKVAIDNFIEYISFKMDCAREQELVKCKLDKELIDKSLEELYEMREEKFSALIQAMPKDIRYKQLKRPVKMYKKDGSLSSLGAKWMNLASENNVSDEVETITVVASIEDGNPGSKTQLKEWLFMLGWEPQNFEFRKNTEGEIKKVPQIYTEKGLCPSVKSLYTIEPALENLDMLSLINHRIGIFESYKDSMDDEDFTRAEISGLTNTLRFKHRKPIVNLPKVFKFYGEKIRGSIISPGDEYILCGSDMSSLEDTTKQHYMYYFDPEYVIQMRVPGFDPHIDIGLLGNMITQEEADFFRWYNKTKKEIEKGLSLHVFTEEENHKFHDISEKRGKSKTINFAGIYGAGPPKISQSSGMSLELARKLHKTYWDRNKAVKEVARTCKTKTTNFKGEEQMWLKNPISGFWYSLRYEKDKFSTLNQGSAVFCFDLWVREVRRRGIKIMLQYHDEIAFPLKKGEEDQVRLKLRDSIEAVNAKLNLNVPLDISIDFGINYAQIH